MEIGPSNEKFVVIRKGLNENQEVILNAAAYREKVGLAEKNEPVLASWSRSQGEQATAAQEAAAKDAEARKMRFQASPDAQAQRSPGEGPGEATSGGAAGRPPFSGGPGGEGPGGMRPPGGFNPAMIVDRIFERMDTNKDGKLDPSEIPEDRRTEFMQSDTNGDGAIDKQELLAGFERMRAAGGFPGGFGRRGGPDGGPPRPGNAEAQ